MVQIQVAHGAAAMLPGYYPGYAEEGRVMANMDTVVTLKSRCFPQKEETLR